MKRLSLALIVILLGSCTMQKRMYRPGFNIDWTSKKKDAPHNVLAQDDYFITPEEIAEQAPIEPEVVEDKVTPIDKNIEVSNSDEITLDWVNPALAILPEDCDNIILNNGNEIAGKVIEVTRDRIKYVKCDDATGAIYFAEKNVVFMVKYADGTKEVYTQKKNKNDYYDADDDLARNPRDYENDGVGPIQKKDGLFGVLAFVFSILGLLILAVPFGLLAVIFGFVGINRRIRGLAIAGIIIGIIDIFVGLIIIATLA